jgi:putative methyltransferase (TIGR04325 family)
MKPKAILRRVTPPAIWDFASYIRRRKQPAAVTGKFDGPYRTWELARRASDGWEAQAILEKTLRVSLLLRDGAVEYQQDTLVRRHVLYSPLILSMLMLAMERANGRLVIFDVGGSLGTNFYQNRKLIADMTLTSVRWNIIELSATAALGRTHFESESIRFFDSIEEATRNTSEPPQAVLFSGSLQYTQNPLSYIDHAIATGAAYLALDRLLMSPTKNNQIFVQRPDTETYYPAAYPVWCFSRNKFLAEMKGRGLHLIEHFTSDAAQHFDHGGLLFRC